MQPNVMQPGFDAGGQLTTLDVWLQQAAVPGALLDPTTADEHSITAVDTNARGQRIRVAFGNGTETVYDYDPNTYRMVQLTTSRPASFAVDQQTVQDLLYFYDPVGNITRIRDDADTQNVVFFANQRVEPSNDYTYDPLYRLVIAQGREHLGQTGGAPSPPQQVTNDDSFRMALPQPGDGNAMGNYTESYVYDHAGNISSMLHQANSGSWALGYNYAEASWIATGELGNRLSATTLPGDSATGQFSAKYTYDAHGNMTTMPHLQQMVWDADDRLLSTTRQAVNGGTPATTYYEYNSGSERVRKATDMAAAAGVTAVRKNERVYLGAVEVYREFASDGTISLMRETLHVVAGAQAVAMIETRTAGSDPAPQQQVRYQHGNHLGSAALELDDAANIVSYEEYYPYGSTSYQAVASQTDLPKRYRFTGKERDEENDLNYHGARYYAPWLGRWTSCDPVGLKGGPNLYAYGAGNPIRMKDPTGQAPEESSGGGSKSSAGPTLMDTWRYGVEIAKDVRSALGRNVQGDHPIRVQLRALQRTAPNGVQYYSRGVSEAQKELTVLAETGKGLFHTVVGTLQNQIVRKVVSGTIQHESDLFEATRDAYKIAGAATGTAINASALSALDRALVSNAAAQSVSFENTVKELKALPSGLNTVTNASIDLAFAEGAKVADVATAAQSAVALNPAAKALAAAGKAIAPIAPALEVVGKAAGPIGIAASALELGTAKTDVQKLDATLGVTSAVLLASHDPKLQAAGAGMLAGQALEHSLNVSSFSSEHGLQTKAFLERHNFNEGVANVAGGVVTVASTPIALAEATYAKVTSFFH